MKYIALFTCTYLVLALNSNQLWASVTMQQSNLPNEDTLNWIPEWLDKGSCGPNALYILMNLEDKKISLQEVKQHLPFDSTTGCTLEEMKVAADLLGFPVEVHFVKPSDLSKVPRPFILHGITSREQKLGHFIVVVDYNSKNHNYAQIDPIRERFSWNHESSIMHNFSGYVLLPKMSKALFWDRVSSFSLIATGIILLAMYLKCFRYISSQNIRNCCAPPTIVSNQKNENHEQ